MAATRQIRTGRGYKVPPYRGTAASITNVSITTSSLPGGHAGIAYSTQLESENGSGPFVWTSTSLPSGITLSSSGMLGGTPAGASSGSITFSCLDVPMNYTAQRTLTLTITAAAPEDVLTEADFTLLGAFRVPTSDGTTQIRGNPSGGGGLALRRVAGQVRLFGWSDNSGGSGRVYEMTPPADIGTAVGTRPQDGPSYTQATLVRAWGDILGGRTFFRYSSGTDRTGSVVSASSTTIQVDVNLGSGIVGRFIGLTGGARAGRAVKIGAWDGATYTCTLASGHTWASIPQAGDPWEAGRWANNPSEPHGLTWIEDSQRLYWSYGVAYGDAADNPCLGFSVLDEGTGVATAHGPFGRLGQLARGGVTPIPSSWSAANAPGKSLMAGNGGYYSTFSGSIGCAARAIAEPSTGQQGLDFSQASDGIAAVDASVMMSWPASSTIRGPRDQDYLNGDIFLSGDRCKGTIQDATARSIQLDNTLVPYSSPWTGRVSYGYNATTNGTNTVLLNTTTDLSAVPTDGTVPLWVAKLVPIGSMMDCSPITGISGSSGNWTVTTRDAWPWSVSGLGHTLGGNPNSAAYPTYAPPLWGFKATATGTSSVAVTYSGTLSTALHAGRCLWVGTGGDGTKAIITSVSGSAPNWTVTCSGATFGAVTDAPWNIGTGAARLRVLMTSGAASGESRKVMAWVKADGAGKDRYSLLLDRAWSVTPSAGDTYTLYRDSVRAATSTTTTLGTGEATSLSAATQIEIVAGTGSGQVQEITSWDGSGKIATHAAWTTTPDTTSKYNLVSRGTSTGQVCIDPSGGYGRWTWADYLCGNSAVWIEGASKKGVLFLPSLAVGCVSYYEAAIISNGHHIGAMIFDPDDLAAALTAGTPTAPLPVASWTLSDDIPEFDDDASPNPYGSGTGYSGTKGSQVVSAAFDSVTNRLYVLMQRGWNSGSGSSRPTVYVFSVDA